MSELVHPAVRESRPAIWRGLLEENPPIPLLQKHVISNRPAWLPLVFVLAAIAAVAYAEHRIVVPSLIYLYILPLTISAVFLRKEISYGLIVACLSFHFFDSAPQIRLALRIFHDVSALVCFTFVVYVIQRYAQQQKSLLKTVEQQRDDLLNDVELAAEVQRLFLPVGKPVIDGFEIAGMMQPARGVGGDYYDCIPLGTHTLEVAIADVSGKGVPAALLMSATAAAMRLEANHDRNVLELVGRLNTEIKSVSDGTRYVTLLVAEIDARKQRVRYVNCGHNPTLLFRAKTGTVTLMDSSCPPVGMFSEIPCKLASADLAAGDLMVFYTDGVTEAQNQLEEEFGIERLSAAVSRGSSMSAENLMNDIFRRASDFCGEAGFRDDVTILVVKCEFGGTPQPSSFPA
jgi:serine phosphatase RsbU (regulator of sigma subunit)